MTNLEILKKYTGETDEVLLGALLDDAEGYIKGYTHRTTVPTELNKALRDIALIAYNRLGTEGESGRSEAGESYQFEALPAIIYSVLNQYRIARVGGYAHEAQPNDGD